MIRRVVGLVLAAACGCGVAPRPLRYAAVDMPTIVLPSQREAGPRVEVKRTRILPSIRLPVDVASFLRDVASKAATPVLEDADVNLTTSVCVLICVNTDTASARVAGSRPGRQETR